MYDSPMSESRIKKLWRNNGICLQFHLHTCLSNSTKQSQQKATTPNKKLSPLSDRKLWRKPLPNDCPKFDFEISEKTMVEEEALAVTPVSTSNEIPVRHESRYYENKPDLEAQLERACRNEKAVLLARLLEKQRKQKPTFT